MLHSLTRNNPHSLQTLPPKFHQHQILLYTLNCLTPNANFQARSSSPFQLFLPLGQDHQLLSK
jgi:hypothetical protein